MKIVLFSSSFLPVIGGRELVLHHLAQAFVALGQEPSVVVCGGWWRHRNARFAYPVRRIPMMVRRAVRRFGSGQSLYERYLAFQLERYVASQGGDVIHAHTTYPQGYVAMNVARRRQIPVVVTPHGADIHTIPDLGHGLRLNRTTAAKIGAAIREAAATTAISQSIEQALAQAGAPAQRIRRIENGVDIERFQSVQDVDVRRWLNISPDARLIITVGNYHPRKGQEVMIRAMAPILGAIPDAHLVVVGRGCERLRPLVKGLRLDGRISFTGLLTLSPQRAGAGVADTVDWLSALYRASEVYVSAGIDEGAEGLSLAVLEAMAAGLPVVASDISGNRDLVREGYNGLLVPPRSEQAIAHAVVRLLNDRTWRDAYSQEARVTARRYAWRAVAQRYLSLYHEVQDSRSGGG